MSTSGDLRSFFCEFAQKYWVYLASLFVIVVSTALFSVFVSYQIKEIIDAIVKDPAADVVFLLGLFVGYKVLHQGMFICGKILDIKYKPKLIAELAEGGYFESMKHSLHWFDSHLSGEISSKITDFQDSVITLITVSFGALSNLAVITIGVIFLYNVNQLTALVMTSFILVYVPVIALLLNKQMKIQEAYAQARQESVGIINDSIANVFAVKIIGNVSNELNLKLRPSIEIWKNWDKKARQFNVYYINTTDMVLIAVVGAAQMWVIAYLFKGGQITAGEFAFVAMITLSLYTELSNLLGNILFSIIPNIAKLKTSYKFFNSISDVTDVENAMPMPPARGKIEFDDVTFAYGEGKNVFAKLNIKIKAGERIGVVGTSGAGKTTLIKCLLRYFKLQSGRVLIDETDISEVTEESVRASISVIPQDVTMFHRSILENLQIANYDATLEEIKEACKKANIHHDIEKMPEGYNSIVGERGVKLSGGQRQRVAIARAILKNAPILILDEATSALDSPTEILIKESINKVLDTTNATTIVIAHRLSTLMHLDRILVFEHGKVVEEGTHKKLLTLGGVYSKLWNSQVGGFLPDNSEDEKQI